jgi:hypothetical protein
MQVQAAVIEYYEWLSTEHDRLTAEVEALKAENKELVEQVKNRKVKK